MSIEKNEPKWFKILENVVLEMKPYARHGLNVNVDFYSGAIYNLQKIPKDYMFLFFQLVERQGGLPNVLNNLKQIY